MSEQDASEEQDEPVESESGGNGQHDDETDGAEASGTYDEDDLDAFAEEADAEDLTVGEDLVERVEAADSEQLAQEISSLRLRVEELETTVAEREAEREELESSLKRTKADFQNYKKRMKKRREEEKQRATEDLVERLVDVRDNLKRAVEQDEDADIRDGVEATLRQFDEELERENVAEIAPEPGTDVDPQRHEVLLQVESTQPEGTVAEVHRPGYEMAETVLREAQVTVSDGSADASEGGETDAASPDESDEASGDEATEE